MCWGGGNSLGVRNKIRQANLRVASVFISPSFVLWFFSPYFSLLIQRLIYGHIVLLQKSSPNAIPHMGPRWPFQNRWLFLARRHEHRRSATSKFSIVPEGIPKYTVRRNISRATQNGSRDFPVRVLLPSHFLRSLNISVCPQVRYLVRGIC